MFLVFVLGFVGYFLYVLILQKFGLYLALCLWMIGQFEKVLSGLLQLGG